MNQPRSTAATDADRMATVRALSVARRNEELAAEEQLARTERALDAVTVDVLHGLVADLSAPPTLPVPTAVSRRGLLAGIGGLAVGVVGTASILGLGGEDEPAPVAGGVTPAAPATSAIAIPSFTPTPTPTQKAVPSLYTIDGLELLLRDYRRKFGTWWTYELSVFGPDQARSDVLAGPPRKRRLQWWSWDPDDRWNTIFDPQPATPEDRLIDLRDVDLDAVLVNQRQARRSLGVEKPQVADFEFTHHSYYGASVIFSVTNKYSEYGHLLTDLAGNVLARQPFQRS